MHSLFYQLPNCNLFTQHVIYLYGETPLVNCGPWSILLHIYYHLPQAPFTFCMHYLLTANKYLFLHDMFNPLFSVQVGTKYLGCVVCRFHVVADAGSAPCQSQLASTSEVVSFSYWSIKLWFHNWGKTYWCAHHTFLLGFPTGPSTPHHQQVFWRRYRGERGFLQRESLTSNLFYFIIILLSFFILFYLFFIKNTKN
jgi:hypothetical protein